MKKSWIIAISIVVIVIVLVLVFTLRGNNNSNINGAGGAGSNVESSTVADVSSLDSGADSINTSDLDENSLDSIVAP